MSYQNVLSNSGKLRLWRYSKNAGSMGWVLVWSRYITQQPLSVQKHLSFTLQWLCWLQVNVFTWWTITPIISVTAFTFTITTSIAIRIHVYMLSMTYRTIPSLSWYSFLILSTCFQYSCWSSFVTSHTKSLVTYRNFWRCIPAVIFSCTSLFNLGSCELYRFRSYIWRQLNCMTMISQYAINFVDISLGFCGRINW